jgi:hypothetical protein
MKKLFTGVDLYIERKYILEIMDRTETLWCMQRLAVDIRILLLFLIVFRTSGFGRMSFVRCYKTKVHTVVLTFTADRFLSLWLITIPREDG